MQIHIRFLSCTEVKGPLGNGQEALAWNWGAQVLCQAQQLLSYVTIGRFLDVMDVSSDGQQRGRRTVPLPTVRAAVSTR